MESLTHFVGFCIGPTRTPEFHVRYRQTTDVDVISYTYGKIKIKEGGKNLLHTFLNFISFTSLPWL